MENVYQKLWTQAQSLMPGGVSSPVRAFRSVGLDPLIVSHAKGCKIYDVEGRCFIDLVMSWGPLMLGHADPEVVREVQNAVREGSTFGALSEREIKLAQKIKEAIPSIEKIRFVNSGTEAAMTVIRLARAFTGRSKIIKFEGCYHGHSDFLLAKAGSGLATYSLPGSSGVPEEVLKSTLVLAYNDLEALERSFHRFPNQIAAVLVEPIAANMGVVPPREGFLQGLRSLCKRFGCLLIFDEVITGFRVSFGGAQGLYKVQPDLTILGKIIGGGFPVGAVGGRAKMMDQLAPSGPVYQAGTLSGNPVAMAAGLQTLEMLQGQNPYRKLEHLGRELEDGLSKILQMKKIPFRLHRIGSLMTLFFTSHEIENYEDVLKSDSQRFKQFFKEMFEQGVFLPPSPFEAWFLSLAHSKSDIQKILKAASKALNFKPNS
ncbi:MAG: glutamate-1-semialdehyde 2,1-aminomutase [Chlamydiae bacterium]|nr:glutamate-1-semialdehyde 2,1-aminomutase [Chlamydiota bacterium]MBI3277588.1 glutamate-1-semialdehyde 2,1-aminomutase [Chlamydiota bacterium]